MMNLQTGKVMLSIKRLQGLMAVLMLCAALPAAAERLKDITSIAGVRSNHLVGYGLVIGLDGSGDSTNSAPFTVQSLKSMLAKFGVVVPPNINPSLKNVAAVMIHAELPPFAKPGQTIDITVSSIANAKSLRGGSLLMAPLKGVDGQTYAIAQGNMVVGGFGAEGGDGTSVTVNIPSVGRIPNGATVEREVPTPFSQAGPLVLNLKTPDFTTAMRVAEKINTVVGDGTALPIDSSSVQVQSPANPGQKVAFLAMLQAIEVTPGEAPARVIVNARTGTIVIDSHVRVMPVAVSHGSITVSVTESFDVSQPRAFTRSRGAQTVVTPSSEVAITQENNPMFLMGGESGVALKDVVRAVNKIGAAPGDLASILQALKQAGALRADLIVI
jgi:flagellar P-ring protein precursor FlgI